MPSYHDDNYGHWEMEDENDIRFYHQIQRESVMKKCVICGRKVKLRPDYDKCNTCCDILERGGDPG